MNVHVRRPDRHGLGRGVGHRPRRQRHHRTIARTPGAVQTVLHHAPMVPVATDNEPRPEETPDERSLKWDSARGVVSAMVFWEANPRASSTGRGSSAIR